MPRRRDISYIFCRFHTGRDRCVRPSARRGARSEPARRHRPRAGARLEGAANGSTVAGPRGSPPNGDGASPPPVSVSGAFGRRTGRGAGGSPASPMTGRISHSSGPFPRQPDASCPGTARSFPSCTRRADPSGRIRAARCLLSGGRGCRGGLSTACRQSAA